MTILYSLALLATAALLFLLEPMVGKFVLPTLGSTPEVWTTAVMFFQVALLAGYGFTHLTSRLAPRRQALLQLALLAAGALVLPIGVPDADPPETGTPIPWLLGLLAVTAGLPFLALATTGPMLQRWLASTRHRAARDPYFLFAASNGGSLLGLLAYPLLLEPGLDLDGQGEAWSAGYAGAALLVAASAATLWLAPARAREESMRGDAGERIDARRRLSWLVLAAVPSSLMLGTTSYLTRDLSPVPLLWVVPLAVYLLTFVVAFAPWANAERLVLWTRRLLPAVAIAVVYTLGISAQGPLGLLLVLHLAGLGIAALLCHSRLAAQRPAPSHLTEFYLWVALGGALGGAFNAVLSPVVFPGLVEYPVAIVAAVLMRPRPPKTRPDFLEFFLRDERPTRWMDAIAPLLLGVAVAAAGEDARYLAVGLACGIAFNFARRPLRFGLALGAILLAAAIPGDELLERDRSFFGIYTVEAHEGGLVHELYSGTTLHGTERLTPGRPEPLSYYARTGPAGQAFAALPRTATGDVAAIGLGAGALACYGGGFTFFEIDETVARIARDPDLFTYLRDCPARVVLGDGRRELRAERRRFGLVVVDAFNSDAIPVHLLTREALELYLERTGGRGPVMFHVTNRYLDLEPVLGNLAADLAVECRFQSHDASDADEDRGIDDSDWTLLARRSSDLGGVATDPRWRRCRDDPSADPWTDSYSNLLAVVDWG